MMKVLAVIGLGALLSGCASAPPTKMESRTHADPSAEASLTEIVTFQLAQRQLEVRFFHYSATGAWHVSLQEPGREHWTWEGMSTRIWGLSAARCDSYEAARFLSQALNRFHRTHPDAQIDSVFVERYVVQEFWTETVSELRAVLGSTEGYKGQEDWDRTGPENLRLRMNSVLQHSSALARIARALGEWGLNASYIGNASAIVFKDELTGLPWKEVEKLSGFGIAAPGAVVFEIK